MKKYLIAATILFASFTSSAGVVITSGKQGGTYSGVYGVNLLATMKEMGAPDVSLVTSKGSLENLDRVASGEAQIGFTQADALMYWRNQHPKDAAKIEISGELNEECIFAVVKDGGKVSSESDIKDGIKVAVGSKESGSFASWGYLQTLNKDYANADTIVKGGSRVLSQVLTDTVDVYIWVATMDKPNDTLTTVMADNSGFKMIDLNDWSLNNKLPNGKEVYTFKKAVIKQGVLSDTKVEVPCMKSLIINNVDTDEDTLDILAKVILQNRKRILGN